MKNRTWDKLKWGWANSFNLVSRVISKFYLCGELLLLVTSESSTVTCHVPAGTTIHQPSSINVGGTRECWNQVLLSSRFFFVSLGFLLLLWFRFFLFLCFCSRCLKPSLRILLGLPAVFSKMSKPLAIITFHFWHIREPTLRFLSLLLLRERFLKLLWLCCKCKVVFLDYFAWGPSLFFYAIMPKPFKGWLILTSTDRCHEGFPRAWETINHSLHKVIIINRNTNNNELISYLCNLCEEGTNTFFFVQLQSS